MDICTIFIASSSWIMRAPSLNYPLWNPIPILPRRTSYPSARFSRPRLGGRAMPFCFLYTYGRLGWLCMTASQMAHDLKHAAEVMGPSDVDVLFGKQRFFAKHFLKLNRLCPSKHNRRTVYSRQGGQIGHGFRSARRFEDRTRDSQSPDFTSPLPPV